MLAILLALALKYSESTKTEVEELIDDHEKWLEERLNGEHHEI